MFEFMILIGSDYKIKCIFTDKNDLVNLEGEKAKQYFHECDEKFPT